MQLGRVVGMGVSTIKHATLAGWRLLLVQMLARDGKPDGEPVLAIDPLSAGVGDTVILSNDGRGTRQLVGSKNTPARWMIIGIRDEKRTGPEAE